MDYVRDAWYVAGRAEEFGEALRSVPLLDERLLMYRRGDGQVVALEDRCPHRALPLSLGVRVGDAVRCGYHGLTFAPDGRCVRVPGQERIPPSARVDAYPVVERHGLVFVWPGDPARADERGLLHLPQLDAPGWHLHHGGTLEIGANYLAVAENLVDPAHVSFVHPTTLGSAASEDVAVETDVSGDPLVAWRWIRDAPPVGFFQAFGGFAGNVDRWHYYYLHLPCTAVIDFGSADVTARLDEEERDRGLRIFALHFLTPVGPDRTIDRWLHVRNAALGDEAASATIDAVLERAFAEDVAVLEAVEASEAADAARARLRRPLRLAIDEGPVVYRRRIAERIAAERGRDGSPVPAF